MNGKNYSVALILTLIAALIFSNSLALAKSRTFQREYTYQASEADSKLSCRAIALEQVKRLLLEELGTYLEAQTEVRNFQLTRDQITTLTAGIVQTEVVEEKWDGEKYWLQAEITADPDKVAKSLDDLRKDYQKTKELQDLRKNAEQATKEIKRLRNEIASLRGKSDTEKLKQYNQEVDKLSSTDWAERGRALESSQDYEGAIEAYTMAIRLCPNNASIYDSRGVVYLRKNQDTKALADLNKAIELDPAADIAYTNRGLLYMRMGQYGKALADLNKAIEINPENFRAYSNLGELHGMLGNYTKALANHDKAIKLNPTDSYAYVARAKFLSEHQRYHEAISDIGVAIELDPQNSFYYGIRGGFYLTIDWYDKAIDDFTKALALTSDTDSLSPGYYFDRGTCYLAKAEHGDWQLDKALADFNRCVELDPSFAMAYGNRAAVYGLLGMYNLEIKDRKIAARMGNETSQRYLREKGIQW